MESQSVEQGAHLPGKVPPSLAVSLRFMIPGKNVGLHQRGFKVAILSKDIW